MTLSVELHHAFDGFSVDTAFDAPDGVTALFGPSGSGKTTIINAIAGLLRPDRGRIVLDGETLLDTNNGAWKPAYKRRIGYVFQEARLFPHMTVRRNLLYGQNFASKDAPEADFTRIVEMLGIGHLTDRRPAGLSGGERQRVAIGRALLSQPRLLLMDEPLASLDAERKAGILPFLERLRDETDTPIIYVSHSVEEVARLATTVVTLSAGRVTGTGTPSDMLSRQDILPPDERDEAGSLLDAKLVENQPEEGISILSSPAGPIYAPLMKAPVGAAFRLRIRARDVMVATSRPQNLSALNALEGHIESIGESGDPSVDIRIACSETVLVARLTRASVRRLALEPGMPVFAVLKTVSFDRHTLFF